MTPHFMAFTSSHMLLLGLAGFLLLIFLAVWFYRESSKSEGDHVVPDQKPGDLKKTHFIPVVNPGKVGIPPRLAPTVSKVELPVVTELRPAPTMPVSVTPAISSGLAKVVPPVLPAVAPEFKIDAEVRPYGEGEPSLVVSCRGDLAGIPVGTICFEVRFKYEVHDGAQLRICPSPGAAWRPLTVIRLYDRQVVLGESFVVASVPLRELSGPVSGSQLVQVACAAYRCDEGFDPDEAALEHEPYHRAKAYVFLELEGLGFQEVAQWLAVREKFLSVVVACASDETDHRDLHRLAILDWISFECQGLKAHSELVQSSKGRLLAVLDSSHLGTGTTASACHELMRWLQGESGLIWSLSALFERLGKVPGLSRYVLERISKACLWLGISCPIDVEEALAHAASQDNALPDVREAVPVSVKPIPLPPPPPPPRPARPFVVSLSLLGAPESAMGFQVMVSGDLPARTSSTEELYFSVTVRDADARTSRPFLVPAADVDGLHDLLKPSVTVARDRYDPSAPRRVAEVLFKDCAFPRNGERTLQVSCIAYSADSNGSLTRLCHADAEGTLKIHGTGYVTLRKRRRSLRGLTLQLALAAGAGGSVTLAQKTIAKEWIAVQAASIADPDERKQTVNSLTKILLGAVGMSQAELVALALRLSSYRQLRYSQESVRLAELLADARPATKPKMQVVLVKIRKELGLPAVPARAKPSTTGDPRRVVSPVAPPAKVKNRQPVSGPKLNPRQIRARSLDSRLGRTLKGWKAMSPAKKVDHLRRQILEKSARMQACKGLADRNVLQEEITDMSELVVLIRSRPGQS